MNFQFWVLAQQDPKKFKWVYSDAAMEPDSNKLGRRMLQFAAEKLKVVPKKGDVYHYAKSQGKQEVFKVQDGDSVRYVDDKGKDVKMPNGFFFIETKHPDATKKAKQVMNREA